MTDDDPDTGDEDYPGATREFDLDLVALEEARRTIDKQNEVLNNIDDKAARILRMNLVVIGLLLTGASVAVRSGSESETVSNLLPEITNIYTELGVLSLLLSTAFAGLTYTASALRIGLTGDSLRQIVFEGDTPDRKRLRGLANSYASWIEQNYETNAYNAPLATGMLLLLVYAVTLLALGGIETLRPVRTYEVIGTIVFLAVFTHLTGIKNQIQRYLKLRGKD